MTTKAELEKMIEERAEYYATNEGATIEKIEAFTVDKHLGNPQQYEYVKRYNNDSFCSFKSGASFVTGILMHEIERLKDNALKENEVIIRLTRERDEFIDRMIKAEIALGKQATLWEKELSEANATIQSLKDEIEVLRRYGNKDCTAMADEALTQKAEK